VAYAFALANKGEFDRARSLVRFLAFHPHFAPMGQSLLEQLESMQAQWLEMERRDAEWADEEALEE
jgi:hypothetical protein